jgi:phage shock protein PspC (stress-responsive transcriptional regulator)
MQEPQFITKIRHNVEREWFGVLTRMGSKLGIPVAKLRVFFIYSTFATVGIFFAFSLWVKDIFITRRPNVFDL